MSKIPYVIQEDSPNLVIVPTESCYEPLPNIKPGDISCLGSSTKVPEHVLVQKNVLVNNAAVKLKPRVSSVNKNVLIDVSAVKRQQNSWATNFLQSIGGSSSKLPRAYNWHSSASKLAFPRNEIQPITYSTIAHPEMYTNTTQLNAKMEAVQSKSIKELTFAQTNTLASQPTPNNDFHPSNRTNETIKPKAICFTPNTIKETPQPIDKAHSLPTVNNESSHPKASKETIRTKRKKEVTKVKSDKEVARLKAKKEMARLIASKKNHRTKETIQTKVHKKSTKLRSDSETSRTKVNKKATDPIAHKAKYKETAKKRPLASQVADENRENIALKKLKVEMKKQIASSTNKDKKAKKVNSKEIKRESSKSSKSTSPIKSVIKKVKNYTLDSPQYIREYELDRDSYNFEKIYNEDTDIDLRSKLKRKAPKNENNTKEYEGSDKRKHNTIFPKTPHGRGFVPDDNLIISFENENDTKEVIEKIKPTKAKSRKHQCKRIKFEISIVIEKKTDTSDDESSEHGEKEDYESFPDNDDLSFLDDFNVDEIAESLNDCQNNIVKTVNQNNLSTNEQPLIMHVDLPMSADENILNEVSISKNKIAIENNNTISSVLFNEKSLIKREQKAPELNKEVQSSTDHNCATKNNNDNSELKSENILQTQRALETVKVETEQSLSARKGVKTEFILNDVNNIKEASSEDHAIINTDNIEKMSESVILPAELKLENVNILTSADITPIDVNTLTPPAKLNSKTPNSLHKKNTEIDQTTNMDYYNHARNLSSEENATQPKNISETKHKVKTVEDDVILIDDSDDERNIVEVEGTQNVLENNIIDLTFQNDCSLETNHKKSIPVDAFKSKTVEADSEPILILDTDYDELKAVDNIKNITNSKRGLKPEPIETIKKHLFRNSDANAHASDNIKEKPSIGTLVDHKTNTKNKENQNTNTDKQTVASKNKLTDNIVPVDTKNCAKSGQDQLKQNTQEQKEKPISTINENDDINITTWLENKISENIRQESRHPKKQKNGKRNPEVKTAAKENNDNVIRMWIVSKGDTRTYPVKQNQPKINLQDTKDAKPNTVNNMNTQSIISAKYQPKTPTSTFVENKIAPARAKSGNKINTFVKGDPRNKLNKIETNSPDSKLKTVDNTNTHNITSAKCQPKAPTSKVQASSIETKIAPAREKTDNKPIMYVKGDPRNKLNNTKTNSLDSKPKTVNNTNIQNTTSAKCQPKAIISTVLASSVENKIAFTRETSDNKTIMFVKGDPRNKINETKTNSPDSKPKTVDNMNTQKITSAKCQPKAPTSKVQASSIETKIAPAREKTDNKPIMFIKGDPRNKLNETKTNSLDSKTKTEDNTNTQNTSAKCQPKAPISAVLASSVENKIAPAREKSDNKTIMFVKGDPRNKLNETKTNSPDNKPKPVDNKNTQNIMSAKCQPKEPTSTVPASPIENKISPARENSDNKTNMSVKGDPRNKMNETKTNSPDSKPKTVDSMNTQNIMSAKCQPKTSTSTVPASLIENKISPARENSDNKTNMLVKGDPRNKTNETKTNSPDNKPKPVDNKNTQNIMSAKCQPKEPTSTVPASIENKISPARGNSDNKTNMFVKGNPTNKLNDIKTNSPDSKPKIEDNTNTQNKISTKCQPKAAASTVQASPDGSKILPAIEKSDKKTNMLTKDDPRNKPPNQTKANSPESKPKTANNVANKCDSQANLSSELAHRNLLQVDTVARRLESRMRVYFGAKILITDLIHSGEFSTIYRFKDESNVSKTVKQIKSSWQMGASKEAMMMKIQNGVPESNYNCVRHYRGFSESGLWCYVMEYYPKNLHEVMTINNRSFHIDQVQEFSRQLVAAVTILRNNNIIHSDINPLHILINDSETRLKLCGFDQAFYYNGSNLLPNVGTPNYRAPELILGFHSDYSIDVWATALVIYEMATNRQLFPGHYNNDILYKQLCTVDRFSYDMLEQCYFRNQHFMGEAFVRIVGSRGEGKILVHNFFKKDRIHSVLSQVYFRDWAKFGANKAQDKEKLFALGKLLNKMLVMDPRRRITIEFVFADPFIYEML